MKWQPITTAPHNKRIIVQKTSDDAGPDEIAMAWLDRIDGKFWYAPQGGQLTWVPTSWQPIPK